MYVPDELVLAESRRDMSANQAEARCGSDYVYSVHCTYIHMQRLAVTWAAHTQATACQIGSYCTYLCCMVSHCNMQVGGCCGELQAKSCDRMTINRPCPTHAASKCPAPNVASRLCNLVDSSVLAPHMMDEAVSSSRTTGVEEGIRPVAEFGRFSWIRKIVPTLSGPSFSLRFTSHPPRCGSRLPLHHTYAYTARLHGPTLSSKPCGYKLRTTDQCSAAVIPLTSVYPETHWRTHSVHRLRAQVTGATLHPRIPFHHNQPSRTIPRVPPERTKKHWSSQALLRPLPTAC